jgi:Sec-independent protein translocase protein TatA
MDFLGIGIPEVILILVLMLVVLGPKDMVKTGRQIGRLIRKVITSPAWTSMMTASREIREFPTRLVRDAGIEEEMEEIRKQSQVTVQIEDPRILDPRKVDGKTTLPVSSEPEKPHLPPSMQADPPRPEETDPQDPTPGSESAIDPQI